MGSMVITDGKGVQFKFDNGITISIQIGGGNYCENYNEPVGRIGRDVNYILPASRTAEIAGWNAEGDWFDIDGDMVKGYVPVEDVLRFTEMLRDLPSDLSKSEIEIAVNAFDWREKAAV